MIYNHIPVSFGALRTITAPRILFQEDVVQFLDITGLDLPELFNVDFCNVGDSTTKPMTGENGSVRIPDEYLASGKDIEAYILLTGTDDGAVETRYKVTIPVKSRPTRTDIQPTPAERLEIDVLTEQLNTAVSLLKNVGLAVDENGILYLKTEE